MVAVLLLGVVFTSCLVSGESVVVAGEQVRTPGSSVTFWTPEMRGGDGSLRQVLWKHGADWLLWLNDGTLTHYGNATKDRILLNKTDGSLSILELTLEDSGWYTVELDDRDVAKFTLRVISPVPVPRVSMACRPEGDTRVFCSLTCEGDTAGAEPVRYLWHHPHANISTRTKTINTTVVSGVQSSGGRRHRNQTVLD
ncbi:hypothetical protein CRUP_031421 [Coryphaenoides rupestris]|nr:hypothetical protein CRUP_031421 [Coryphaenoides rupestris]